MKKSTLLSLLLIPFSLITLKAMEKQQLQRALGESRLLEEERELQEALAASLLPEEKEPYLAEQVFGEQIPSRFEQLPSELHAYVAQFLGNTISETIKNIVTLGQVNRFLYDSFLKNPETIRHIFVEKFGKEAIAKAFLDTLATSTKLDQIKPFFEFNLLSPNDIPLLNTIDSQWLKKLLFAIGIKKLIEANPKSLHFTRTQNQVMSEYSSKQPKRFLEELIAYLIGKGILNLNQAYSGETPLDMAVQSTIFPLFLFLETLGANVNDPINQIAMVKAQKLGWKPLINH